MKLDFVIPGFSKCGTTTLCSLLCDHPDLFIPAVKEPNFFAHRFREGWDWYENHFDSAGKHRLWGDGSTTYSSNEFAEVVCDRILKHFPEARFIFIARDPVRRLESSFREFHHSGYKYGVHTPYQIGEALQALPNMIADSQYWTLINKYRVRVPDSRMHVLFLEDFKRDPSGELQKCFAFLGVDPEAPIGSADRQLNAGSTKYYDTRLMQFIHRNRWTNRLWWRMDCARQERWGRRLGLRRPLTRTIVWTAEIRQMVFEKLGDEIRNFLAFYRKPADFWRFEAWARGGDIAHKAA